MMLQGASIKQNPLEKMLYFSHGSMDLSQTFRLFIVSIRAIYPANFIEIIGIVPQIQWFKLQSSLFQVNMQLHIEYA